MKKKILTFMFSIFIILSSSISVQALPTDKLETMDYTEQKEYITELKTAMENRIENIEVEKENNEKNLNEAKDEIIKLKKNSQAKKNVNNATTLNISNDNLKMWEVILNSNSFSDMMNNFDLMKKKKTFNDKYVNSMEKQEDIMLDNYFEMENTLKALEEEYKDLEKDLKDIKNAEKDLIKKIERKSGELTFNPNDLLKPTNMSVDDMYKALEGTALHELAPIYIEAENVYGVNALFIAGITAEESGWGTSKRAVEDNNLTGLGVYSDSSVGINARTKRNNILMTAKLLKNEYLSPGGSYYNGYSIRDVNTRYCIGTNGTTDYNWSVKITNIATNLLKKVKS